LLAKEIGRQLQTVTTLFQITVGYDEINSRYAIAAYDIQSDEATGVSGTINKVWKDIGTRIKDKEKMRKNFPLPEKPVANGSSIIVPNGDIELPPDRKIITSEF
jgi:hypothetical protein